MTAIPRNGFQWTDLPPSDPDYWPSVRRNAMADYYAGRIPIWRVDNGNWIFFGYENDPEACRARDEFDRDAA